jgi:RNA polymerase sigma-70 factor (ECF subfamily)
VTTRWTVVCEAARGGDTEAVEALGALFETYWPPLYRYVRRLNRTAPDAEDLVQGFFAHLLEQNGLGLADRDRGRFRAFLLGSLKHYMANEWQRDHRLKRGGFAAHLSIDWQAAETGLGLEPADERSPDKLYDREWAMALLDKVLDDLAREEKELDFARWKPFLSVSSARLPYAEIAGEFGMSEGAARVAVHRLRKRYRQRLRDEIGRTLADDQLVDDEMRSLFAALSG